MQTSRTLFKNRDAYSSGYARSLGCSKEAKKTRFLAEADNYFKAGDYDKAKVSYLNVVQLGPTKCSCIRADRRNVAGRLGTLRAIAFLAKGSELNPNNVQNRVRLARSYVATGRLDDARKEALKVLDQSPDNTDALIVLSEAARSKEGIDAAEEQLQKFPKKTDVSFTLLRRICFSTRATWSGRAMRFSRRSLSILNRPRRTWQWETCIYPWRQKASRRRIEEGG